MCSNKTNTNSTSDAGPTESADANTSTDTSTDTPTPEAEAGTSIRKKETAEELTRRLQNMKEVQRRFDLDAPMELQMRKGGAIQTSEDLAPRYRFVAPMTIKRKLWEEHMMRLEAIPDVTVIRGSDGKVRLVDIPVDSITKAEIDYNETLLARWRVASVIGFGLWFSLLGAFITMSWWILSADPGAPPEEPIGSKVFLEIYADEERLGTVVLGLYTERCPMTCENFHRLVTGNTVC